MNRDTLLLVGVAVGLALAVGIYVLVGSYHESRRPEVVEVRVVSATEADPVFRDGVRRVVGNEKVELVAALRLSYPGKGTSWLAPVEQLTLTGATVTPKVAESWPESDRFVRIFWFTIEAANLGGEVSPATVDERLTYRTYLVPSLGQGLRTTAVIKPKNSEFLGHESSDEPLQGGTLRFYARAEVAALSRPHRTLHGASSLGSDHLDDPSMPVITRVLPPGAGVDPMLGELLNLPGFEPLTTGPWHLPSLGIEAASYQDLVAMRLVTSSASFAAVAVSGKPELDPAHLQRLGTLTVAAGALMRSGNPVRWGAQLAPRDLLVTGNHWIVLLADDGDGILDEKDQVLHSWHSPGASVSLTNALDPAETTLELRRYVPPAA